MVTEQQLETDETVFRLAGCVPDHGVPDGLQGDAVKAAVTGSTLVARG